MDIINRVNSNRQLEDVDIDRSYHLLSDSGWINGTDICILDSPYGAKISDSNIPDLDVLLLGNINDYGKLSIENSMNFDVYITTEAQLQALLHEGASNKTIYIKPGEYLIHKSDTDIKEISSCVFYSGNASILHPGVTLSMSSCTFYGVHFSEDISNPLVQDFNILEATSISVSPDTPIRLSVYNNANVTIDDITMNVTYTIYVDQISESVKDVSLIFGDKSIKLYNQILNRRTVVTVTKINDNICYRQLPNCNLAGNESTEYVTISYNILGNLLPNWKGPVRVKKGTAVAIYPELKSGIKIKDITIIGGFDTVDGWESPTIPIVIKPQSNIEISATVESDEYLIYGADVIPVVTYKGQTTASYIEDSTIKKIKMTAIPNTGYTINKVYANDVECTYADNMIAFDMQLKNVQLSSDVIADKYNIFYKGNIIASGYYNQVCYLEIPGNIDSISGTSLFDTTVVKNSNSINTIIKLRIQDSDINIL